MYDLLKLRNIFVSWYKFYSMAWVVRWNAL